VTSTSATERAVFRRCRRQWFLGEVHRLEPQEGNVAFWFGHLWHQTLEVYNRARMEPALVHDLAVDRALDAYQALYDASIAPVKAALGFVWPTAEPMYRELGETGLEMLQAYLDREGKSPVLDTILAVEFRVYVPIRTPGGRKIGTLSVQADVVGYRDGGTLAVVDYKTASRSMSSAHLDLDDQLTAEVYSWWKATGDFPEQAVYDVAMKKAAKPPKLIKKGTALSVDKAQSTTHDLYLQAIKDEGFKVADYADMLIFLREQEEGAENPFFRREVVFRTAAQMAAFERDLYQEFRDMRAVAKEPARAYPSPSPMNCPGCPVRVVCTTIQDDGDVEAVVKGGYNIADARY
jgi:hypothetical protein